MFRLPELRRLFRFPRRGRLGVAEDVDRELEFHLAMRVSELERRGLSPADARAAALERFGDVAAARRDLIRSGRRTVRAARIRDGIADYGRDVRFAGRELVRHRSFTIVAVTVLGLGIGLPAAVASVFDRLVLHPLPYPHAERLGVVSMVWQRGESRIETFPTGAVRDALRGTPGVARVEAHRAEQVMLEVDGAPDVAAARVVTPGLLDELGARAELGRLFAAEDTSAGAPLAVVLSHATWQRRFGGVGDVLGRGVRIEGAVATVIGVMAPGFDLTALDDNARAEVWLPLRPKPGGDPRARRRTEDNAAVLITVAPGRRVDELAPAIEARVKSMLGSSDELAREFQTVVTGSERLVSPDRRRTLALLLGAAGLVLLVACANVAGLLLGQALTRGPEFLVRESLGASTGRLVRQLAAEATLLGGLGLGVSIAVSAIVLAAVRRLRPATLLTLDEVHVGAVTLGVAAGVGLLAVGIFGLAPIWAVSRGRPSVALLGRARTGAQHPGVGRLRSALVVGQIAVTLMLLVGAGLLVESFVRERHLPLGFDGEGLTIVSLELPRTELPNPALRRQLVETLVERIRRLPGVRGATASEGGPLGYGLMRSELLPEGQPVPDVESPIVFPYRAVSPDYFAVIGQPLLAGRPIRPDSGAHEIVIDGTTAHRLWGDSGAIGRRIRFDRAGATWETVVGVVGELRTDDGTFRDAPTVYWRSDPGSFRTTLLVRSSDPAVPAAVSRAVRDLSPDLRIRSAATVPELLDERTAGSRFSTAVALTFAGLALGLALVGLYGVIAYAVRQRQFEFGVRLALGAVPARVRAMVLREGLVRIGLGLVLGLGGSLALGRLLAGMLYRTSPWDPGVFGAAAAGLVAIGLLAIWLPALSASRTDPLTAIRAE